MFHCEKYKKIKKIKSINMLRMYQIFKDPLFISEDFTSIEVVHNNYWEE